MINPRFKVGDVIQYNPVTSLKRRFSQWIVRSIDDEKQTYHLWHPVRGGHVRRELPFKWQTRYRVHGLPLEEQPPMYPDASFSATEIEVFEEAQKALSVLGNDAQVIRRGSMLHVNITQFKNNPTNVFKIMELLEQQELVPRFKGVWKANIDSNVCDIWLK